MQGYPWVHAAAEGLKFGYQLLYLLEASPYYSPALRLLRQRVVRVSGAELVRYLPQFYGFRRLTFWVLGSCMLP